MLRAQAGMGKTTVLRWVQARRGGSLVPARQFMTLLKQRSLLEIEEGFPDALEQAVAASDLLLFDDLHLLREAAQADAYSRARVIDTAMSAALAHAEARDKKFLFAIDRESDPRPVRALAREMDEFGAKDFACICGCYLGQASSKLDFEKIHRFAPSLNGYQLKNACLWLGLRDAEPSDEAFIDYLNFETSWKPQNLALR